MEEEGKPRFPQIIFYLAIIAVVVLLFLFLADNPDFLGKFMQRYGLIGMFLGALIANSTVLLPLPLDFFVLIVGADPAVVGLKGIFVLDALIVGIVVGFGAAIGEMTSYILGLTGFELAKKLSEKQFAQLEKITDKVKTSGTVFIFLGALIPSPFDLIGIVSGLIKFDVKKFFLAAFAGKSTRYFLLMLASHYGLEAVKNFFFHT